MQFSERITFGPAAAVDRVGAILEAREAREAVAGLHPVQGLVEADSILVRPVAAGVHSVRQIHRVVTAVQIRVAGVVEVRISTSRMQVGTAGRGSSSSVLWLKEMAP
jgi:hypothetical protein